jgi:hypothetical protein
MTTGRRRGGEPRLGVVVRGVRWTVASSGEGAPAVFDLPAEDAAGAFRAFLRAHGFFGSTRRFGPAATPGRLPGFGFAVPERA